jgi:hypothetical protein
MKRRDFVKAVAAGTVMSGIPLAMGVPGDERKYCTLEWFRCRRDMDVTRMRDFLGSSLVPALNRAGVQPVGLFQTSVGPDSPSMLVVAPYDSMAAIQETGSKLAKDEKYTAEQSAFDEKWELAYERREAALLQTFKSIPGIEIPKVEAGKSNIFELRMYESRNLLGHTKKVKMFDEGEITLFRRVGVNPVFFGSTVFGARIPNLVYMIYFSNMEARTEAWAKFGQDPDWKKMSTAPGMADRELVSTISNQILTPLTGSQLK